MRNKEINKVFKQVLKSFIENTMGSCSFLSEKIEKCKTYEELETCLKNNVELIANHLGYECFECDDKEDKIDSLEKEYEELGEFCEIYENLYKPVTLYDEQKLECFIKYKDNFTPEEFESLLS